MRAPAHPENAGGATIAAPGIAVRSGRVAVRGDDLVGGASDHFGHVIELAVEAAGTGGRRAQLDD
jgi:hypothetical protein